MTQQVCESNHPFPSCKSVPCISLCQTIYGVSAVGQCKGDSICHCYYICWTNNEKSQLHEASPLPSGHTEAP
ncbi:hypothetical protein Hanom_Chr15g01354241 [Helianthus anomalus]